MGMWRQKDEFKASLCSVGGLVLKLSQKFINLSRGTANLFLLGPKSKVFDWQFVMSTDANIVCGSLSQASLC